MSSLFKTLVLVSIIFFTNTLVADEKDELKSHFFNKLEEVKTIVQNKKMSKDERYDNLIISITPVFDFELMAKLSLGKTHWNYLKEYEKTKFVDIYTSRMKNSYLSKLETYNDQIIKIISVIKKKNRISMKTHLESDDKILDIIYKFYKPKKIKENKDTWLIYDVEIIGVSILKADKAQFKDFLQTKSLQELMLALQEQK